MRFRLLPPRPRKEKQQVNADGGPLNAPHTIPVKPNHAKGNQSRGSARSISSWSTGATGPMQGGDPIRRQSTGPFQFRALYKEYCDDEEEEVDGLESSVITEGPHSRFSIRNSAPLYDVEIRAQGADDDTLCLTVTEEKKDEDHEVLHRMGPGIFGTLRRPNSIILKRSQQDDDDDTLEEIMNDPSGNQGADRRDISRRVRTGILELLRRSSSKILDRHELWLKTSLQAIEDARESSATANAPPRRRRSSKSTPHNDCCTEIQEKLDANLATPVEKAADCQNSVAASSASSGISKRNCGAMGKMAGEQIARLHEEKKQGEATVAQTPSLTVEQQPQEDEMSVTMVEVFVHYLTCCHVLRENELKKEPRGLCVEAAVEGEPTFQPLDLNLDSQPKGLCVTNCMEDDDENTFFTDDDTRDDSLLLQPKDLMCNAVNSELSRSGTNTTFEKDD